MANAVLENYSFNAAAKTITFTDFGTIQLDNIKLITNVTDNVIIYDFSDPLFGGTVATNVLTLTYDTAAMSNTDRLQIIYDDKDDPAASSDTGGFSLTALFKRALQNWTTLQGKLAIGGQLLAASLGIAMPRKLEITGFLSIAATNTNLLDGTGSGAATDVRDYQSGHLIVVSTATTGSYTVQIAQDSGFTIGVTTLQLFEVTTQNVNPINAAITPTNATRRFAINLQGANYLRVNMTSGAANVRPYLSLNQGIHVPHQINVQQATAANLRVDPSGVTSPVSIAATLVTRANSFNVSATITRAANTTPYTALDVYGAAFQLTAVCVSPFHFYLTDVTIIFNITAVPSGMAGFILYLYNVTPPSAIADNGAFSLPSGDRASCLTPDGIPLGNAVLANGGGSVVLGAHNLNIKMQGATANIFGYLVTTGAFTPAANSETATIRVQTVEC